MSKNKEFSIQFLGAAQTVTGSRTLITYEGYRLLIDCGMFQGPKDIRVKNWEEFKDADKIDAVILTHAHIDHTGYLPKLVKEGFRGVVYASAGTVDLSNIMLIDSAYLQEEDARYLNRKKASRHDPALPLYTIEDAENSLKLLQPVNKDEWIVLRDGISFRLLRSGHILGSTFVQLSLDMGHSQKIITFSGDLGHDRQHVIRGPVSINETDILILEGTYGDRFQPREDVLDQLKNIVNKTYEKGGVLVIPSFAVGRTQELLYLLAKLEKEKQIPDYPIYVDSPMANNATDIYLKYKDELKLSFTNGNLEYPIYPEHFEAVRSVDESMMVTMQDGPFTVVSAAGMLTGGRVLHHLRKRLPDPRNTILFVGYQAEETKGRLLQQGLPKIRIHKQLVDVEAEIVSISSLSAHGDCQDLVEWVERINKKPGLVFLNHGELAALKALKYRLRTELGLNVTIPHEGEVFKIE